MSFYNDRFYDKFPLGYDSDKCPESEAEELVRKTLSDAMCPYVGVMKPEDAVANLQKAAKMGYTPALYICGWLYQYQPLVFYNGLYYREEGKGLYNYRKAEYYYKMAFAAGDMNALYALGTLYIFGTCGQEPYHGTSLSKGFIYMYVAAKEGVVKAAETLSAIVSNDIYNDRAEIVRLLYDIAHNDRADQSVLRYNDEGLLVFDPDALHLMNFRCIYNKTLVEYWKQKAAKIQKAPETAAELLADEPEEITDCMEQAVEKLKEYEKTYLAYFAAKDEYERNGLKKISGFIAEFKYKYGNKGIKKEIGKGKEIMKNAIGIKVVKAEGEYDLGASKFFGTPTVPGKWLEGEEFYDTEMFLCQIRCADIAELDEENRLPHTGYLYVFLDMELYPYTPHVIYYNGEPDTAWDDFNEDVPGAEHLTESWLMQFEAAEEDADGIRLLGTPTDWCYGEEPPSVLLQYDPLASAMGFADSMDGYVYLLFGEDSDKWEDITYREERG